MTNQVGSYSTVLAGILFTQGSHYLLTYTYFAIDTFYELQDTVEHLADTEAERYGGAQKVIGDNNALEL